MGDDLNTLFAQATQYAKAKVQAQTKAADPMKWVYIGGAGVATVLLLALIFKPAASSGSKLIS